MAAGPFIAVDWGSSNRRAWRVVDGKVEAEHRDSRGLKSLQQDEFPAAAAELREKLGDLPMLCAGMVGARTGWAEAPYVAAPVRMGDLITGLKWVEDRTAIVPGVRTAPGDRPDVMRGEEVPVFGALAHGLAQPGSRIAKPGTHAKWITLDGDALATFRTAMTGELFDLLQDHSLLHGMMDAPVDDGEAFRQALADGRSAHLPTELFGVRAAVLLGTLPLADAAARVSGLLIGADVAANAGPAGTPVTLIAGAPQNRLYGAALEAAGHPVTHVDSNAAFLGGIEALWSMM